MPFPAVSARPTRRIRKSRRREPLLWVLMNHLMPGSFGRWSICAEIFFIGAIRSLEA